MTSRPSRQQIARVKRAWINKGAEDAPLGVALNRGPTVAVSEPTSSGPTQSRVANMRSWAPLQ
jgi:hypothetical protein